MSTEGNNGAAGFDAGRDPRQTLPARIIEWSLSNRFLVILGAVLLLAGGILALNRIALDAVPDLSDTQVIIRTDWAGQAPQVIEDQVTFPLSTQMLSLPGAEAVRGVSMTGTSFLYIIFEEGTDMYWARSRVLENLSRIEGELPEQARAELGPDATGVGWVFQYALVDRTGRHDLQDLRALQDWFVKFELSPLKGVAEVASVGGFEKEYQVRIDPLALRAYGLTLAQIRRAVARAGGESGGRTLEMGEREYLIRAPGYIDSTGKLEQAVLKSDGGTPVTLGDVARVVEGGAFRRGIAELDGKGEVVGGIVVMRPGANALDVISRVKQRLERVRQGLPEGVEIRTVYDRSSLIVAAVSYLAEKLLQECLIVALVTFAFLLHVRSALVAIITLPLGILAAFIAMALQGIPANIMSLGGIAIAIGAMVDAAIVMVDNVHRKLAGSHTARMDKSTRLRLIGDAAKEVGPGLFVSLLIITVSFLPVFVLGGQSYKLFAPLAFTKTYAMAAAALLSVTLVPVLMLWFIRGRIRRETDSLLTKAFIALYRPLLNGVLQFRKTTLLLGLALVLSCLVPLKNLGSEFMPPLYEGDLLYMPMTLPGVTPAKAREILQVTNRQIMSFPEVEQVFGKAGRADTATDPAPLPMIESWITLKPRDEWRPGMTPQKLMDEMDDKVGLPGMTNSWGYPIKIRLDMLRTGIRTAIGIKISGDRLEGIDSVATDVESLARQVPGTRSAMADRVQGADYIEIVPDRRALARYGLALGDMQDVVQSALGGAVVATTVEGRARYGLSVRYDRPWRNHVDDLADVLVATPGGGYVPMGDIADIRLASGPAQIKSEDGRLNGWVFIDPGERDIGSYVADLRTRLADIDLPAGYALKIAGRYEQMQAAYDRLKWAVPATFLIIITLLYLYFGRWDRTALILAALPVGLSGGLWAVWLAGYNLSVAVAVGFIALAGVAVETALVMLLYIDDQMRARPPQSYAEFLDNIREGALMRLRPKLMTALTIIFGLIPIFLTFGPGTEAMRRIALPMIGGMASTLALTLLVVPALYALVFWRSGPETELMGSGKTEDQHEKHRSP